MPAPPEPTPATAKGPALKAVRVERLGIELGIPSTFREVTLQKPQAAALFGPFFGGLPSIFVATYEVGDLNMGPEGDALHVLQKEYGVDPRKAVVEDGWVRDCPLGEVYRVVFDRVDQDVRVRRWVAIVRPGDRKSFYVELAADVDDLTAAPLSDAILRSLKPLPRPTDK
jgi:hypothetical protein